MSGHSSRPAYQPLSLAQLGGLMRGAEQSQRWRLIAEFLEDWRSAAPWVERRSLRQFWFPFNTPAARADALVHAPAAFRRRGVYVAPQELDVA